jgi:hypothetical protein
MKETLSFVDLLKPEDATLLPFLALLAPNRYAQAVTTLKNRIRALRVRYGPDQQPKDRNFIGATVSSPPPSGVLGPLGSGSAVDDVLLALADAAAAGGDAGMVGSTGSFLDRWVGKLGAVYREQQLDLLLRVLRVLHQTQERAFDVEAESDTYLKPATELARRGYEAIVFGHTHLAKQVPLAGRATSEGTEIRSRAVYFNSGTWADLMTLPSGISAPEGSPAAVNARSRLAAFADDLASNRLDAWRRLVPTFVRIELDDERRVTEATLEMLGEGDEPMRVTTEVVREHLEDKRV